MSGLSTHVLDQTIGRPAQGVKVAVYRNDAPLLETITNADGRCDDLQGDGALIAGRYRLVYAIGAYFAACGGPAAPFFDTVTVEFVAPEGMARCHVPLLVSPFGYSTYRGS